MKTREQIYGQEAAGILRDVSMYRALTEMQLLKLYPHKESKIRNLLSYVYVPDSKPREYRLIAKFRVEPDSEVPAIDAGALTLNPGDTVAVEVKKSLARHLAGREFTVSFPQSDYTYTIQASKHNDWHEFTVPAEEEQEAPV